MERTTEPANVLANWWEYWRRSGGSRDERKAISLGEPVELQAAHDLVHDRVQAGGPDAVALLVALNDAGPAEDDGIAVGVGPLEDLVHEHGDSVIDDIERNARQSPRFARALSHVWLDRGHLSKDTEERFAVWVGTRRNPGP